MLVESPDLQLDWLSIDCHDEVNGTVSVAGLASPINRLDNTEWFQLPAQAPDSDMLTFRVIHHDPTSRNVLHLRQAHGAAVELVDDRVRGLARSPAGLIAGRSADHVHHLPVGGLEGLAILVEKLYIRMARRSYP
jgi:hypothetical protein